MGILQDATEHEAEMNRRWAETNRQADELRLQRGRTALGIVPAELEIDRQPVRGLPIEARLAEHGAQPEVFQGFVKCRHSHSFLSP